MGGTKRWEGVVRRMTGRDKEMARGSEEDEWEGQRNGKGL